MKSTWEEVTACLTQWYNAQGDVCACKLVLADAGWSYSEWLDEDFRRSAVENRRHEAQHLELYKAIAAKFGVKDMKRLSAETEKLIEREFIARLNEIYTPEEIAYHELCQALNAANEEEFTTWLETKAERLLSEA